VKIDFAHRAAKKGDGQTADSINQLMIAFCVATI
jgi:hypothetical protein